MPNRGVFCRTIVQVLQSSLIAAFFATMPSEGTKAPYAPLERLRPYCRVDVVGHLPTHWRTDALAYWRTGTLVHRHAGAPAR